MFWRQLDMGQPVTCVREHSANHLFRCKSPYIEVTWLLIGLLWKVLHHFVNRTTNMCKLQSRIGNGVWVHLTNQLHTRTMFIRPAIGACTYFSPLTPKNMYWVQICKVLSQLNELVTKPPSSFQTNIQMQNSNYSIMVILVLVLYNAE